MCVTFSRCFPKKKRGRAAQLTGSWLEWTFSVLLMSSAGDRLLEVDGISFQGFTYQQAVECLSKTEEVTVETDFAQPRQWGAVRSKAICCWELWFHFCILIIQCWKTCQTTTSPLCISGREWAKVKLDKAFKQGMPVTRHDLIINISLITVLSL